MIDRPRTELRTLRSAIAAGLVVLAAVRVRMIVVLVSNTTGSPDRLAGRPRGGHGLSLRLFLGLTAGAEGPQPETAEVLEEEAVGGATSFRGPL